MRHLQHYFEYPKVTRVHTEVGFYQFPGVTICNSNPVMKSKVGDLLDDLFASKLNGNFSYNMSMPSMTQPDPYVQARTDFTNVS